MKWIESFVPTKTELVKGSEKAIEGSEQATKGSSKRPAGKLEQEDAKRHRIEEENESAELKRCLKIIPDNDDDVTIEATPLSSKSPTIVDYKIYKEGRKSFFKIIRADGKFLRYIVTSKGIRGNPEKTKAVMNMPSSSSLKQMQWLSAATEEAFQAVKKLIAKLPMLTAPMKDKELMVYLSAANEAVSAVLLVERNERQIQIHYDTMVEDSHAHTRAAEQEETSMEEKMQKVRRTRSGACLILIDSKGTEYSYALRLNFTNSNNDVEYEALLTCLRIVAEIKV
uniref:Reverse transcriptase domain-containing protein n=1 Tax=Tanacetum cinerariifolium TaxID=118510 RepID=A0A6L2N4P9_TANCI|nr:hypothetical protein [Tanacetum cinerariifolium]